MQIRYAGFTSLQKVLRIGKDSKAAQTVCDAIAIARGGAPGAVVIELPLDVQTSRNIGNEFVLNSRTKVEPSKQDRKKVFRILGEHIEKMKPLFILGDVFRTESLRVSSLRERLARLCEDWCRSRYDPDFPKLVS